LLKETTINCGTQINRKLCRKKNVRTSISDKEPAERKLKEEKIIFWLSKVKEVKKVA